MNRRCAMPALRPVLLLAMVTMLSGVSGPASAQGRIESFFNDASRFLQRQGRAIERELDQLSTAPRAQASRSRKATATPPLPIPNPRRTEKMAEATSKEPAEDKKPVPSEPSPSERPHVTASRTTPVPGPARPERKPESEPAPAPDLVASAGLDHDAVPLPDRNPAPGGAAKEAEKPKRPPHPREIASADWTKPEIDGGRSACTKMLARIVASYEVVDPIREGICGAPAPIRLSAINSTPRVEIRPPALVTCALAVQLAHWMAETVQPAARKHLGEQIVAVRNVASYSCRNRYNAPGKRISEHALVNALDIASFETASGRTVTLLGHWHAKAPKHASDQLANKVKAPADDAAAEAASQEDRNLEISPAAAKHLVSASGAASKENPPVPDPKPEKPEAPEMMPAPESEFLHMAFDGACKTFGTVLGPEANAAHRNHFHLDMKARTYGGYCE